MRAILLVVVALCLSACGAPAVHVGSPDVSVDTPALRALKAQAHILPCPRVTAPIASKGLPDKTLPCLGGGRAVDLARLRGPLVVNLWSQTCGPCREELPRLQAFAQKYAGKVRVLGVDWEDPQPDRALQLAKQTGVTYPLVADLDRAVRTSALPTTILVDSHGAVVFQRPVLISSVAQLAGLVRQHLGVRL